MKFMVLNKTDGMTAIVDPNKVLIAEEVSRGTLVRMDDKFGTILEVVESPLMIKSEIQKLTGF